MNQYKKLREMFFARLERKTNWGRVELKEIFNEVMLELIEEMLDESQRTTVDSRTTRSVTGLY